MPRSLSSILLGVSIIFILMFITLCSRPSQQQLQNSLPVNGPAEPVPQVGHVTFYLENSGGMHGYVADFNDFIEVLSELAQKPRFVQNNPDFDNPSFDFNFINGIRGLVITPIGHRPTDFTSKLNTRDINVGNISGNDLNAMFQLALSKAGDESISIFISDAIYDIQNKPSVDAVLGDLVVEGRETRTRFINRLNIDPDIQTLLIKLSSNFRGRYYYGVSFDGRQINQERPYYIFIFGNSELLNDYFNNDYLVNNLAGYQNHVRFYVPGDDDVAYRPTPHSMIGSFRFSKNSPTTLTHVRSVKNIFQFSVAVDFSSLPLTEEYLMNKQNYVVSNNYEIELIEPVNSSMILGAIDFVPTHLITLKTNSLPTGEVNINLLNRVPDWIDESHIIDDTDILNNTDRTFGFSYLTNGIIEAYHHVTQSDYLATISIQLER